MDGNGTMNPLQKVNKEKINFGEHQMTIMDTSQAWESFKQVYQIDMNSENGNTRISNSNVTTTTVKQKKSSAFKNFQGILEFVHHQNQ